MVKRSLCASLVVLTWLAAGCDLGQRGPQRGAVRGTVQLDQEPIQQGYINFFPIRETKGPSVGARIIDGEYALSKSEGPMVGTNRVEISSKRKTGKQIPAGSPYPPGHMIDETTEAVPAKYNTETTLEHTVEPGRNVFDFTLTSQ